MKGRELLKLTRALTLNLDRKMPQYRMCLENSKVISTTVQWGKKKKNPNLSEDGSALKAGIHF